MGIFFMFRCAVHLTICTPLFRVQPFTASCIYTFQWRQPATKPVIVEVTYTHTQATKWEAMCTHVILKHIQGAHRHKGTCRHIKKMFPSSAIHNINKSAPAWLENQAELCINVTEYTCVFCAFACENVCSEKNLFRLYLRTYFAFPILGHVSSIVSRSDDNEYNKLSVNIAGKQNDKNRASLFPQSDSDEA